jgi:putative nucleotidyltransferase with HDIG domain
VATLHDALVVLGFRQLRTLVVAASVNARIPGVEHNALLSRSFWQHGLLVGLCAQVLARACGHNPDGAFTAGLLHDVGRLALGGCFADEFREVENFRRAHDCYLIEAETEVLGIDHAQVGGAIAARWGLPASLKDAIASHHAAEAVGDQSVALIHVADVMAHALDLTGITDDLVPALHAQAWIQLGLDWSRFKSCLLQVEKQGRELLAFSLG